MHWISMRMPNRGGAEGGTPELYFDPDGLRIQLQDRSYCGVPAIWETFVRSFNWTIRPHGIKCCTSWGKEQFEWNTGMSAAAD